MAVLKEYRPIPHQFRQFIFGQALTQPYSGTASQELSKIISLLKVLKKKRRKKGRVLFLDKAFLN